MKISRKSFNLMSIFLLGLFLITSCNSKDLTEDTENSTDPTAACFSSGDILVSSSGADSVVAFDGTTNEFKAVVYSINTAAGEAIYGMEWLPDTEEVAIVVDGTDRVMAVSAADCSERILIANANLTGNVRGIAQLSAGDLLVVETSNVERFTSEGIRVATGGWPRALQTTGTEVSAIAAGGFVHCSTGSDVIRTYDDTGVQTATVASGIAATTDASGCKVLADGTIAAAWSGTTDTVSIYDSTLASSLYTYSNTSILSTPGGLAQRANGNILVVDRVFNYVVEITNHGVYVGTIGSGLLSTPEHVMVVP